MFYRVKAPAYNCTPSKPDALLAKRLQEPLGGQWGEISVMMMYMFQGWNCRGPGKYRDMLLDIATEEIGHVEMLVQAIAQLLEGADADTVESTAKSSGLIETALGGGNVKDKLMAAAMNPQHMIVSGQGAMCADSVGYPWTGKYIVASGNLLADFRMNVTAESQGRLQVCRIYGTTEDAGVHDMMKFMIARDTMHQNQWLAAIEELQADGLEMTPVPSSFPQSMEDQRVNYAFMNQSEGTESMQGRWAKGPAPDGRGTFQYMANVKPMGVEPVLGPADPKGFGTPKTPAGVAASKAAAAT